MCCNGGVVSHLRSYYAGFVILGLVDYTTILKKATGPEPDCRVIEVLRGVFSLETTCNAEYISRDHVGSKSY